MYLILLLLFLLLLISLWISYEDRNRDFSDLLVGSIAPFIIFGSLFAIIGLIISMIVISNTTPESSAIYTYDLIPVNGVYFTLNSNGINGLVSIDEKLETVVCRKIAESPSDRMYYQIEVWQRKNKWSYFDDAPRFYTVYIPKKYLTVSSPISSSIEK